MASTKEQNATYSLIFNELLIPWKYPAVPSSTMKLAENLWSGSRCHHLQVAELQTHTAKCRNKVQSERTQWARSDRPLFDVFFGIVSHRSSVRPPEGDLHDNIAIRISS